MPPSKAIVELQEQIETKQKDMLDVFRLAGPERDFSKKEVLEKLGASDSRDAVEKVKGRNLELETLGLRLQSAQVDVIESDAKRRDEMLRSPGTLPQPTPEGRGTKVRSFGELFTEHEVYAERYRKSKQVNIVAELDVSIKTLFQTTAGFAPESVRTGLLVDAVTRPIQILDLIPTRPLSQALDKYMEETTRTHASAEKAEGIAYAESTFVWTERTNPVQKVTDSIPVTDEQIEDEPQVAGILDQRLRFGLRQRLDLQVLAGNGTPPNLKGILATAGIQTQAKGADPVFDAFYKALTLIRFTGRAVPNASVFHPTNWQDVRLTRTADGLYILGNPSEPGPQTLFGIPITLSDAITLGTALVGDFANFCYIGERRGIEVQIGYISTQFTEGKKTLRADLRAAFTVTRPAAFCTITGL